MREGSKRGGRSRSKSPFSSFRWKKSKSSTLEAIPGGSASDDESNIQKYKGIVHHSDKSVVENNLLNCSSMPTFIW